MVLGVVSRFWFVVVLDVREQKEERRKQILLAKRPL
jgi:hypothetical protein